MKKIYFISTLLYINVIALLSTLSAKENIDPAINSLSAEEKVALAASCDSITSIAELDINKVRTSVLNGGDMWWDVNDAKYEVPKDSGIHAIFAGSIWLGGIDEFGQLKVAAQTYRQSGYDFWPGPLDDNAETDQATCNKYNRHWKVNKGEVDQFKRDFENGNTGNIPASILEWPAKGNPYAKGSGGVSLTINEPLAPFTDYNNDGLYDPYDGDYPAIMGEQAIWWVINDKGNTHTETNGTPFGFEIHVMAYALTGNTVKDYTTFYHYDIINKSSSGFDSLFISKWVDTDLGCYNDDYVGCDTSLNLGYSYNGNPSDPSCASAGYGDMAPIIGVAFMDTIPVLSSFVMYNNDFTDMGNPESYYHFYYYQIGKWKDDTYITYGGNGYGGSDPYPFMFSGDPTDTSGWSECQDNSSVPSDRRFLLTKNARQFASGEKMSFGTAAIWQRDLYYAPCPDISPFKLRVDSVMSIYHDELDKFNQSIASGLKAPALPAELNSLIYPNPVNSNGNLYFSSTIKINEISIYDLSGRIIYSGSNLSDNKIDLSEAKITAGVYLVRISGDNYQRAEKVIIK